MGNDHCPHVVNDLRMNNRLKTMRSKDGYWWMLDLSFDVDTLLCSGR